MDPEFLFDPSKLESLSKKRQNDSSPTQSSAKRSHIDSESQKGSPNRSPQRSDIIDESVFLDGPQNSPGSRQKSPTRNGSNSPTKPQNDSAMKGSPSRSPAVVESSKDSLEKYLDESSPAKIDSESPRKSSPRRSPAKESPRRTSPRNPQRNSSPMRLDEVQPSSKTGSPSRSPRRLNHGSDEENDLAEPSNEERDNPSHNPNEEKPSNDVLESLKQIIKNSESGLEEVELASGQSPNVTNEKSYRSQSKQNIDDSISEQRGADSDEEEVDLEKEIRIRCVITGREAGIIIGKGGAHVAEVRRATGMVITVTPQVQGVNDRIMTFDGPLKALRKTLLLIADKLASRGHADYLKPGQAELVLLIPGERMGFLIGKGGVRIKELQQKSGCKINSKSGCIGNSDERTMSFVGKPDQLQKAIFIVGCQIGDHFTTPDGEKMRYYDPSDRPQSRRKDSFEKRSDDRNNRAPALNNNVPDLQSMYASLYPQMQMLQQFQNQSAPFQFPNLNQNQDISTAVSTPNLNAILQQATQFYAQNMANLSSANTINPQDTLKLLQSQYQNLYSGGNSSGGNSNHASNMPTMSPARTNPDGSQVQDMLVPDAHVGAIIGKRGSIIKDIRSSSGCKVIHSLI